MIILTIIIFGLKVRAAGYSRQARLNVDVLGSVLEKYHKVYGIYPEALETLPKFYVMSVLDRLYVDSNTFKKKKWRGYSYDYARVGSSGFVLSVSPIGFWPAKLEFGITEKGILKVNGHLTDSSADSHEEVEGWQSMLRLSGTKRR